jgi:hypothetical protein
VIVNSQGNEVGGFCHHSLRNIPDPTTIGTAKPMMSAIPVPCIREACANWDLERGKCGDVVQRELLQELLEKLDG